MALSEKSKAHDICPSPTESDTSHFDPSEIEQPSWKPTTREWLLMGTLGFISFVISLDATILVTVLPVGNLSSSTDVSTDHSAQKIASSLDGSPAEASWAGTSYLLTSAVLQPLIATISKSYGRQQLLVASITLFTLGNLMCALARAFPLLLAGRSVQGAGGGGVTTMAQVIFCDIVPLRQRPKYFSVVLGAWSVGSILGPVAGGLLVERLTWRWCFHINFPFCGIGLFTALSLVRTQSERGSSVVRRTNDVDWLGAFMFVGSLTACLVGISWGGIQFPWTSPATLVPIALGSLCLAIFFMRKEVSVTLESGRICFGRRASSTQPTHFLSTIKGGWGMATALYCALANGLILFTALYYLPLYQMAVLGATSVQAGIGLFPAVCLLVPTAAITAFLITRYGQYKWAIWLGWIVTTFACGLFVLFDNETSDVAFAFILALFGIGNGMVLTGVNTSVQAMAVHNDPAMAASMYGSMRSLGMPLGVALSATIYQNTLLIKASTGSTFHGLNTTGPATDQTLASRLSAVRMVFIMMTSVSASALVASFAIKRTSITETIPDDDAGSESNGSTSARRGQMQARARPVDSDHCCSP